LKSAEAKALVSREAGAFCLGLRLRVKSVCLTADLFAFGELLGKVESRTIPK
jgi:hypothetical protein